MMMIGPGWALTWFLVLINVAGTAGWSCFKSRTNETMHCDKAGPSDTVTCYVAFFPDGTIKFGCLVWVKVPKIEPAPGTCGKHDVTGCPNCDFCHCGSDNCDARLVCKVEEHDYCKRLNFPTTPETTTPAPTLPTRDSGAASAGGRGGLVLALAVAGAMVVGRLREDQ